MNFSEQDELWMHQALILAQRALNEHEVPIGSILVKDNKILGRGWNHPIVSHDPTAHAEINAIRATAQNIKNYRLVDTTMYVTLEPCIMCLGAIIQARIGKVVFGAYDRTEYSKNYKADNTLRKHYYHNINNFIVLGGLLEKECANILQDFFQQRRKI